MSRLKDMNEAINAGFRDFASESTRKPSPRYGVRTTADAANKLNAAVGKYPDDLDLYHAATGIIDHAYKQSGWIEKVFGALMRSAQEAER